MIIYLIFAALAACTPAKASSITTHWKMIGGCHIPQQKKYNGTLENKEFNKCSAEYYYGIYMKFQQKKKKKIKPLKFKLSVVAPTRKNSSMTTDKNFSDNVLVTALNIATSVSF